MACCAVLRCRALGLHGGARPRERRPDGLGAVLGYVGIDLRRAYIAMSEEFLHGADVMTLSAAPMSLGWRFSWNKTYRLTQSAYACSVRME